MNQPSHYQSSFFDELSQRKDVTVLVVYARGQTLARQAMGWTHAEKRVDKYTEITLPERWWLWQVATIAFAERRSIHLLNGIWAERPFMFAVVCLLLARATFFFHSESAEDEGGRRGGLVYCAKSAIARTAAQLSGGIFAIGAKGVRYYAGLGVSMEKLFKFSYFVDGRTDRAPRLPAGDHSFRILFLGQFIPRKRVEDLLRVMPALRLRGINAQLRIIGNGPLRDTYQKEAKALGCSDLITIEGPIAPAEVPRAVQSADVVVLPSSYDGWGITVNEALHAGVPAIATTSCGASEILVSHPKWGGVYQAGDTDGLLRALLKVQSERSSISRKEVDQAIGAAAMTTYFLDCIRWRISNRSDQRPKLNW